MVKGYILKNLFSSEIVQRLHVSILFSRKEVPWDFGICAHPAIKDVLCEDPVATTYLFFFFFLVPYEERLFHLDIIRLPWLRGHKPETHDVNIRKTGVEREKNKHWTSSLWFAFFFLLQDDRLGPLLYSMDRCPWLNVRDGPQSVTVVTFTQ